MSGDETPQLGAFKLFLMFTLRGHDRIWQFRSLASHCLFPRDFQWEIRKMDSLENMCLD